MRKNKKKVLIILIILAVVIKIFLNLRGNYSVSDIEKDVNIVNYEKDAQLDNPPENKDYGHELGNGVSVNLSNRMEFLQGVNNLDYGLSVINALGEGLNYINIISKYDKESTEDYYNKNREVINALYGIKDYDTFMKLYNDLGNDSITSCTILMNTLIEDDNIFKFNIELLGIEKVTIPVKVLANNDEDMIGRMYFYN